MIFAGKYGANYPKAVDCPIEDQETLLTFFGLRPFTP